MRHNGRPFIRVSELTPNLYSLEPGWPPMAACPDCGRTMWLRGKKHSRAKILAPHAGEETSADTSWIFGGPDGNWHGVVDGACGRRHVKRPTKQAVMEAVADLEKRCPGSGQRFLVDVSVFEWRAALADAVRLTAPIAAGSARKHHVHANPRLPVAPAVHQIAAA